MTSEKRRLYLFLSTIISRTGNFSCELSSTIQENRVIRGFVSNTVFDAWHVQTKPRTHAISIGECRRVGQKWQFIQALYFVGDTARKNEKGEKIFGLYEKFKGHPSVEILDGIDDLQIKYGLSVSKSHIIYVNGAKIKNWLNVKSVYLKLNFRNDNGHPLYIYKALKTRL